MIIIETYKYNISDIIDTLKYIDNIFTVKSKIVNPNHVGINLNTAYFENIICHYVDISKLFKRLSITNKAILVKLSEGLPVSDIADELQVARSTIYRQLYKIKNKLEEIQNIGTII